jgi:hypothetical protein
MVPGVPAREICTYVRNGTADLYAALDVASGKVNTQMTDQHRAAEFRAFLNRINRNVPDGLDVHVICDNASTHQALEIHRWLARHKRFTLHYTPTSWLNQVNAGSPSSPRRSSAGRPITASPSSDATSTTGSNTGTTAPRPFIWRTAADQILDNLA